MKVDGNWDREWNNPVLVQIIILAFAAGAEKGLEVENGKEVKK